MDELIFNKESDRQKHFIEQMKKWVQEESEKLGRPLTCYCKTFGCQMNA